MKGFVAAGLLIFLTACAMFERKLVWRVRDMVQSGSAEVHLLGANQETMASLSTMTMKKVMLAHFRITRAAGVQAELVVVNGDDPNAFAGRIEQRQVIAINLAMVKLLGDDIDEFAAILGHEAAHLAKGHGDASNTRTKTFDAIGTLAAIGLQAAGVPAAGTIAGLSIQLIEASYSRDQEREADALGVSYMVESNFNPYAAVRMHEKILKASGGTLLPFLSSHPSGQERIENLKGIIAAPKSP
ncbi:MAG: M48 family metalloprotease [Deltaproteobacteria bacterium]|nr:M48 family metalloprotease [Deltaproteobacteria bacterium]